MPHVVLLGDSIFDNAAYVPGGPPVIEQLRGQVAPGWTATLCAVDGAVTRDVRRQLARLPADATHLVVSAGGNDALGESDILSASARSAAEVLDRLARMGAAFERDYRAMLAGVLDRRLPTAVCTIYHPSFPDPALQRLSVAGLATFNDAIVRVAVEAGLPLIDLRLVCDSPRDYANPIEPSVAGGEKIVRAIVRLLAGHDFATRRTAVFV